MRITYMRMPTLTCLVQSPPPPPQQRARVICVFEFDSDVLEGRFGSPQALFPWKHGPDSH